MTGRADVAQGIFYLTVKNNKNDLGNYFQMCSSINRQKMALFFSRAMLLKSLEQANAPTSQTGGIETQSQGDPCGYKSGVCIIAAFLTILMP